MPTPNSTDRRGGPGIKLSVSDTENGTYTDVANLMDDCGFSEWGVEVIPTTALADLVAKKAPGRFDYGDFSGSVYYVPQATDVVSLTSRFKARTTAWWKVTLNDDVPGTGGITASTAKFQGFVYKFTPGNFTGKDTPKAPFTIAITSDVVVTVGTAIS